MADEPEVLEDHADASPEVGKRFARSLAQVFAEEPDPAARRPLREVEELEQRRLSCARRAGEEIEAASRQREVEVAEHLGARSVAQSHAFELNDSRQNNPSQPLGLLACGSCLANACAFLFTGGG